MFGGLPGLLEFKASLMASHGFVTLALAFICPELKPTLTDDNRECIELDYFQRAVRHLTGHRRVRSSAGVGVVSICFSSHISLLMAALMPAVRCVVTTNGHPWTLSHDYTLRGASVAAATHPGFFSVPGAKHGDAIFPRYSAAELRAAGSGLIKFYERRDVGFMMIAGLDDQHVPSPYFADLFEGLMAESDHPDYRVLRYRGTGHLIEPPHAPVNLKSRFYGAAVSWGGRAEEQAAAASDAWMKQLDFLSEHLMVVKAAHL